MSEKINSAKAVRAYLPLHISVPIVVIAIIVSFADLAFLNDVIGRVLNIDFTSSMLFASVLGLVGIFIMAILGTLNAIDTEHENRLRSIGTHLLWVLVGLSFATIRLFSATIMQLDSSFGDDALIKILGMNVREVDLVLAPVMFLLYLCTGLAVKEGVKNILLNPDFDKWWESLKGSQRTKKEARDKAAEKARARMEKQRSEAEKKMRMRQEEMEKDRLNQKAAAEESRIANAAHGSYSNALAQFRAKEREIKEKYEKISRNIDFIRSIDKQETTYETKIKPSLLEIVQESVFSTQNSIALAIRKKTGEDITKLRNEIEIYNRNRDE